MREQELSSTVRRSGQRHPQMGTARRRDHLFRPPRLGDGPDLREGASAAAGVHRPRRQCHHVVGRHRRRKGRLPESRPDGLRQHLRHGLLFRRGLYRFDPGPARRAHQASLAGSGANAARHQGARQQVARDDRPCRNAARADDPAATSPAEALADAAVTATMQKQLQGIDLTQSRVVLPERSRRRSAACRPSSRPSSTRSICPPAGFRRRAWTRRFAQQTADFIIYSAITTVARRPDHPNTSWTENWPYEPSVGNTPTTNTFQWTWISFCFTFFAMGFVLWLYRAYLDHPDDAPMERGLATIAR